MVVSVFELYSIGIGPSSSHTVGPMKAAVKFAQMLEDEGHLLDVTRVKVDLYGSLALTGKGHATDIATMLGLMGQHPEEVDPNAVDGLIDACRSSFKLNLLGKHKIAFNESNDLLFHKDKQLPYHPNALRFTAFCTAGIELYSKVYYSVGGGFIVDHEHTAHDDHTNEESKTVPYPFQTGQELFSLCKQRDCTIAELMMENEKTWAPAEQVRQKLLHLWFVMQRSIQRGCENSGVLPGGLNVKRRARKILENLEKQKEQDPVAVMKWVSLWALAVNEENAAGGKVVTAPTNGASGIIPAVLSYYMKFTQNPTEQGVVDFLLTAGAIGILYKLGASISAAEMGCMGEVGVACSMAAGGLTAAIGGDLDKIENAAEIGMEHNLGLTCDPIAGLVQIPCIERNTMGAIKAINASLLAMEGNGDHRVRLDEVIATMRQTGRDMQTIYKETSLGGLAVNVPEC